MKRLIGWLLSLIGPVTWKDVVRWTIELLLKWSKEDWYRVYTKVEEAEAHEDWTGDQKREWVYGQVAPDLLSKGYYRSQVYTLIELAVQALKFLR